MASDSAEAPLGGSLELPPAALTPVFPHKPSLNITDPSSRNHMYRESQWIMNVLDECIHRMELVALLPSELIDSESLSLRLGEETVRSLTEHLRLSEQYRALNVDRRVKGHEASTKAVQDSLLDVLRWLKTCPTAGEELKRAGPASKDHEWVQELVATLREFRSIVLERLLMTPTEERELSRRVQEVSLCHLQNLDVVAMLEKEVAMAIKDKDEAISKKDEVIRQLKSSLHQIKKSTEYFVARTQMEAEKQVESDRKTSEEKQSRHCQEISQSQTQLNSLITEHREAEKAQRKKNFRLETEIENWIEKYDTDMGEKQTELEELTQVYEEEKAELTELQEHYAVLEVEYLQIMEERRLAQERREEEEREREVKSRAAVIIQAFWRGARVRKALKARVKSKKGKKGKGKKGK